METHRKATSSHPNPEDAEAALELAAQARATVAGVKTPLWYFIALGAWVAPLGPVVLLLPDPPAGVVIGLVLAAVWVALLVTVMSLVARQMGVVRWLTTEEMRPLGAIMLPLLGAFALLQAVADPSWGPAAMTVAIGLGVACFGLCHRRRPAAGAH